MNVLKLLVTMFALTHSFAGSAESSKKLTLSGSSTVAPLILEIAKAFEQSHPGVRIDVQTGGSSRGVRDARAGLADIGMASRALKEQETDLQPHLIAHDGIGIVVHKSLRVINLSKQNLRDIFTGKIKNWKTFSGSDQEIVVVNRAAGRSELEMFCQYLGISSSDIKAKLIVGENAHGIKTIAGSTNAVTFLSIGHTLKEAEFGVPVKLLKLNGVTASAQSVSDGSYPISRPLNLITSRAPSGLQKQFIEFAKSTASYDTIKQQSFVPTANR